MHKTLQKIGLAAFVLAAFAPSGIRADMTAAGGAKLTPNLLPTIPAIQKIMSMRITAYTSAVDETDSTPFITASGMHVRDGIVATNILPFGTKIEIPLLFGNKVFTVEDRMAKRMKDVVDIWMPSKKAALLFGANYTNIVVLAPPRAISLKR